MADYVWQPTPEMIEQANITRLMRALKPEMDPRQFVRWSQQNVAEFWDAALKDMEMAWYTPYQTTLDASRGNAWADWFIGGETSIALNCVDRHANSDAKALIAETEDGRTREFTFIELAENVGRVANALKQLGVVRGDTVACYMPMVAEVVFAMLATQKIGAIFIPIFSGYAPPAVRERLEDAGVKVLFTADGSMRRGKGIELKPQADAAIEGLPELKHTIVYRRIGGDLACPMTEGRDHWWHEIVDSQ
ncbi:MAG: AMP-binding protein, partial [Nitrospira sp.]|nr:AMP-binding protein [Nitrospira sp.]